jgi:hypothetical protein
VLRRPLLVFAAALLALAGGVVLLNDERYSETGLQIGVVLILIFLIVLVLRYVLLLWLGYLHHIESHGKAEQDGAQPRVTIIVPVYNEATVIGAALRSLLALRYSAFDILVVDDGSKDDTFARAAALEGNYNGVTLRVVRKANGGKASALNTGIAPRVLRWCCAWTAIRDWRPTRCATPCAILPTRAWPQSPAT